MAARYGATPARRRYGMTIEELFALRRRGS